MASRIIDVDYYAGGDRKVVTSVDVYKSIINGFSNRDKLIERLVDSYNNKTAPEIILLTGPAGSGKSFVANNVVKKCEKISRMRSYINRGDSFVSPSAVGNMPKLRVDNLSLSASFLYMSAGLEVGAHREESQYNHLKALLRSFFFRGLMLSDLQYTSYN